MNDSASSKECFIIMPISDPDGYEKGHFKNVYEDIIKPACSKANMVPFRADDIIESDIIHISILKKIIEAPMAICDLSARNPNVLFELGLRQAFDKPVVLIQEEGTKHIFDVAIIRAYEYGKELKYRRILEDQENINKFLIGTDKSALMGLGTSSIIKLLSISRPASIPNVNDPNEVIAIQLQNMQAQLQVLFSELKGIKNSSNEDIFLINLSNEIECALEKNDYLAIRKIKNKLQNYNSENVSNEYWNKLNYLTKLVEEYENKNDIKKKNKT